MREKSPYSMTIPMALSQAALTEKKEQTFWITKFKRGNLSLMQS